MANFKKKLRDFIKHNRDLPAAPFAGSILLVSVQ